MVQAVEASLERLGTDYIDLYWLHIWDQMTPVEEIMRAFDDLVRAGKILYVGVSDAPAWVVAESNMLAELRGWTRYVGLQIEYSLLERTVERELVQMAQDQQMTCARRGSPLWIARSYFAAASASGRTDPHSCTGTVDRARNSFSSVARITRRNGASTSDPLQPIVAYRSSDQSDSSAV